MQAGDTDYDFVERIMREEGFFYTFHHEADRHELIHSDRLFIHGRLTNDADDPYIGFYEAEEAIPEGAIPYQPNPGGDARRLGLRRFDYEENVRTAREAQRDYTFKDPKYRHQISLEGVKVDHQANYHEHFEYPGRYKSAEAGKLYTQNRLRGRRGDACIARVQGDDPRILPGVSFQVIGHPREDLNRGWRPIAIEHRGIQHVSQGEESAEAEQGTHYSYEAELVPDDTEWRAEPLARPRIEGPQPATVVGPPGEEIFTDEYGRVKVQFPWDREGKGNDHSSCWIRVAQQWAGGMWGFMAIPRVGQEVIVDFFDGDPDQPIITGRTYNVLQPPPYRLPEHKTRMAIRSQTHKGDGFNELSFEDEAGQEEVYLHAQRDKIVHVNHDAKESVGNDRSVSVVRDSSHHIGRDDSRQIGRDRKEHVRQDSFSTVDRNEIKKIGNTLKIEIDASHEVTVGENETIIIQGIQSTEAGTGSRTITPDYQLQGTQRILIRGPAGKILLDSQGITIDAPLIRLRGAVKIQGPEGAQVDALTAAIKQGAPLVQECPKAKKKGTQ